MPLAVLKNAMRPLVEAGGGPLASPPLPDEGGDDRTVLEEVGGGLLASPSLPDEVDRTLLGEAGGGLLASPSLPAEGGDRNLMESDEVHVLSF